MADSAMSLERAPAFVRRTVYRIAGGEGMLGRVSDALRYRYREGEIPHLPSPTDARIRMVIGPANSAGQGFNWARAVERFVADASAVSMHGVAGANFSTDVDLRVPVAVYQRASSWHAAFEGFLSSQTHAIWESGLPLLGRRYGSSVERELSLLEDRGVRGALLFHGSDIRPPSLHAAQSQWSPHRQVETPHLEGVARANLRLAAEAGAPLFVSTPDLLQWLPTARWTPVVVDPGRWRDPARPREHDGPPVVVHAPSDRWLKGTEFIEPMLRRLSSQGIIDYRPISGVPHHQMPALYAAADVVLDQFGIGSYGVAACEAMAAGRLVIGHVDEFTRRQVRELTGRDVPIHEATIESLEGELVLAARDPQAFEQTRVAGASFVDEVHSGRQAADALRSFVEVTG